MIFFTQQRLQQIDNEIDNVAWPLLVIMKIYKNTIIQRIITFLNNYFIFNHIKINDRQNNRNHYLMKQFFFCIFRMNFLMNNVN